MEVVLAVMKVAGCRKLSSHMLKDAILEHFETNNLFPRGLCALVCVYKQSDALRESSILRLVHGLQSSIWLNRFKSWPPVRSGLGAENRLWHCPPGGFADLYKNAHTSFFFLKPFLPYTCVILWYICAHISCMSTGFQIQAVASYRNV